MKNILAAITGMLLLSIGFLLGNNYGFNIAKNEYVVTIPVGGQISCIDRQLSISNIFFNDVKGIDFTLAVEHCKNDF